MLIAARKLDTKRKTKGELHHKYQTAKLSGIYDDNLPNGP